MRHRRVIGLLSSLAVTLLVGADESIDLQLTRLQTMPRAERQRLWENLQRFDKASRAEQEVARDLDARIAGLGNPTQQAHYFSVLRRYHLWFESLPDDKRDQLLKTPADGRMALVSKFMADEKTQKRAASPLLLIHIANFGPFSPVDVAITHLVWPRLDAGLKTELEKALPPQFRNRIANNGVRFMVTHDGLLPAKYRKEEDEWIQKIEKKQQLRQFRPAPATKAKELHRDELNKHLALNLYFLEHPPRAVSDSNLALFLNKLPQLVRTTFDIFPPDEAKRRLTIAYRLAYPDGEIETRQKPGTASAPGQASSKKGNAPDTPSQPTQTAPKATTKPGTVVPDAPF